MPRLNYVKKSRKDYPDFDIKKGDSYYWWQFAYCPVIKSKTRPIRSQLTRSEFFGQQYDTEDRIEELGSCESFESLNVELESIIEDIRNLGDEQQDKLDNMPEQLQEAPSGEMLQSRIDGCDEWADNLESVEIPDEIGEEEIKDRFDEEFPDEKLSEERKVWELDRINIELTQEKTEELVEEIQGYCYEGE